MVAVQRQKIYIATYTDNNTVLNSEKNGNADR